MKGEGRMVTLEFRPDGYDVFPQDKSFDGWIDGTTAER
jgi:hypothetical protein